jgi:hypothetical protein
MKGLPPEQHRAIALLVQGKTDQETADTVGVTGNVVTRWRCEEPRFIAALNRQRNTQWQGAHERLRALVHKAVDVLEQAVERGDVRAAVEVLKAVKVYGAVPPPTGPEDPELVLWQQAEAWAAAEMQREGPSEEPALELFVRNGKQARLAHQRFTELHRAFKESSSQT